MKQKMSYALFYKHSVFWVSISMFMVFLILALCLQHAWNNRIYIKVGTENICLALQNFMYFHFDTFVQKI